MEYFSEAWDSFLVFLNTQPPGRIYIFLFLGAFMENLVPPIPGDTLIVFGAYLAGRGYIGVYPAYVAMWLGSALGCLLVYAIAFWKGRALFLSMESRLFSVDNLDRAEGWFSRHGDRVVIFNRFLPTVRAFVGIAAGLSRMHPLRMTLYVFLGTFIWNALLVYFGLIVGENWQLVVQVLQAYSRVIMVLMVVGCAAYWFWRKKRKPEPDEKESEEVSDQADQSA